MPISNYVNELPANPAQWGDALSFAVGTASVVGLLSERTSAFSLGWRDSIFFLP